MKLTLSTPDVLFSSITPEMADEEGVISTLGPRGVDYTHLFSKFLTQRFFRIGLEFRIYYAFDCDRGRTTTEKRRKWLSLSEISELGEEFYRRTNKKRPLLHFVIHPGTRVVKESERILKTFDPGIFNMRVSGEGRVQEVIRELGMRGFIIPRLKGRGNNECNEYGTTEGRGTGTRDECVGVTEGSQEQTRDHP